MATFEPLAEVFCSRCPRPSERIVASSTGEHVLCHECAAKLEFRMHSHNFNGTHEPGTKSRRAR